MKASDINTVEDMQNFVEGCMNDFYAGIATKDETVEHLKDYTLRIIELTANQNLNISNVVLTCPFCDSTNTQVIHAISYCDCDECGKEFEA